MSSLIPTRKVTSGALAGALTVVVGYVLARQGVELPVDVTSALTLIFSLGTAYLVPEGESE